MKQAVFSWLGEVFLVAGLVSGFVGVGIRNNSVALGGLTAGMAGGYYSLRRRHQILSYSVSQVSQSIAELEEINRQLPPLLSPLEANIRDNVSPSLTTIQDNLQNLTYASRQFQNAIHSQLQSEFSKLEGLEEGINTIIRQEVQFLQRIGGLEEFINTTIKKDIENLSRKIEEFNTNIQPPVNQLLSSLNSSENSISNIQQNLSESIAQLTTIISSIQQSVYQLHSSLNLLQQSIPAELQPTLEEVIQNTNHQLCQQLSSRLDAFQNSLPSHLQLQLKEIVSNQFVPSLEALQNSLPTQLQQQLQQQLQEIIHSNIQQSTQEFLSHINAIENSIPTRIQEGLQGVIKKEIKPLRQTTLNETEAFETIETLCRKFPSIAEVFERDYNFSLQNEADVQRLFHVLLALFFDDVRREVDVPNHAGKNSRVDFAIPSHGILIEIKYPRGNIKREGIVRQLAEDFESYREYPYLKTLICFIYNATGTIKHADAVVLENDLCGNRGGFNVYTIVSPK